MEKKSLALNFHGVRVGHAIHFVAPQLLPAEGADARGCRLDGGGALRLEPPPEPGPVSEGDGPGADRGPEARSRAARTVKPPEKN